MTKLARRGAIAQPLWLPPSAEIYTYYVDSAAPAGGTGTLANPYNALSSITNLTLTAGQSVGLKRGSTFTAGLTVSATENGTAASRIVIGAYGTGSRPIINVASAAVHAINILGDFVTVQDLDVRGAGVSGDGGGWSNIRYSGATDGRIQRCRMEGGQIGAQAAAASHRCRITGCEFVNNNKMTVNTSGGDDDYGAHAIFIDQSDDCEVDHSTTSGHVATSLDYGYDGSFVECFNSNRTKIHHNTSTDDLCFVEIGKSTGTCDDTHISYNLVKQAATVGGGQGTGVVTRGVGNNFGPCYRTIVEHNTIDCKGTHFNSACISVPGSAGSDFIVRLRNNILIGANNTVYSTVGAGVVNSYNILNGGVNGMTAGSNTLTSSPVFVSSTDYHLQTTSPAKGSGLSGLGYTSDRDDLPIVGTPDRGCFEYQ